MMKVFLDPFSGFCGGVTKAIRLAENELSDDEQLYCLGEIVHNQAEINRLRSKGIIFISHDELKKIKNAKVIIRAHGEPPATYQLAKINNIELIDATCRIVQRLQDKIESASKEMEDDNGQIVIFGKENHPEVNGLIGKALVEVIVVENEEEINKIDFSRPIHLFSQTTKSIKDFERIKNLIRSRLENKNNKDQDFFKFTNSVCKQVSNREEKLIEFAQKNEVIVFVGGKNSSNAKFLYEISKGINPKSYFITDQTEIQTDWFKGVKSVGITGATSTPTWLMKKVAAEIKKL